MRTCIVKSFIRRVSNLKINGICPVYKNIFPIYCNTNQFHCSYYLEKRRKTAEERKAPRIIEYSPKAKKLEDVVGVWKNMTVQELADVIGKDTEHVFEVMLRVPNTSNYTEGNSVIEDSQVIYEVLKKSGFRYKIVSKPNLSRIDEDDDKDRDCIRKPPPSPDSLISRPPVVTVMGHVDHGKTTLLDALRNTSVVSTEFGGITQHIGAFKVSLKGGETVTFLDTPGHAAFTAMRARGANVTDLVVLVVAADDGVMEQTIESIKMAQQANVPIIVAINKIDKPEADIERTKKMLIQHGIQVEDYGGEIQTVAISALKKTNLDLLVDTIILQAELMELKGCNHGFVEGTIIESKTDPRRGKLSTSIVQRGTLRKGSIVVAGLAWAKVRAMFDHDGNTVLEAPPSTPVEILGWRDLPSAGDEMLEVESEKRASDVIRYRKIKKNEEKQATDALVLKEKIAEHTATYRAQLQYKRSIGKFRLKPSGPRKKEIEETVTGPHLSVIVKGDVDGSVEALLDVLETYDSNNQCRLDVVHYGVGNITESDVELAEAFNALIYGFNVECPSTVLQLSKGKKINIKHHNVIYKLVEDLIQEISSKLPPVKVEQIVGEANVLQQFIITEGKKKIPTAGCRCVKGILKKNCLYRLIRGADVIHEGTLDSMRHLKNEVNTIKKDIECGLQLSDKNVEFKSGDTLICYELMDVDVKSSWNPGF